MAPEFTAQADLAALAAAFRQTGAVVIRGLAPAELLGQLRASFAAALGRALDLLGARADTADPDEMFQALRAASPEHAATILTLGRDFPAFFSLVGALAATPQVRALADSDTLQVAGDLCLLRVDAPNADETGFDWHQDYPYNLMARRAVTVWAPLAPVTEEMGLLKFIPGSHGDLLPIDIRRGVARRHTGQRQVAITGLDAMAPDFERRAETLQPLDAGDVLIFDSHLLHRSGANRSRRSRWVFNARFGDLLDAELVGRRWYTTRVKYPHLVADIHPELVTWVEDAGDGDR